MSKMSSSPFKIKLLNIFVSRTSRHTPFLLVIVALVYDIIPKNANDGPRFILTL